MAEDQELREEVRRLRANQERLELEHDRLKDLAGNGHKPSEGDKPKEGDDGKGGAQGDGKQGGDGQGKPEDKKAEDNKEEKKPKKSAGQWAREHPIGIVVGIVVLIVLVIGGFLLLEHLNSYVNTDDAQVDGHINAVTSRISGTVVAVYIEDNQTVKAGQVLVDIDPRDFKVQVEQSQAQLTQSQAAIQAQNPNIPITQTSQTTNVSTSYSDVTTAQAALSGAKQTYASAVAQLRQAEANYENASNDEARYRQLVDKEEVSREQYDSKLTAKLAQKAIVDAQRASADAAKETIAQRQAALAQAQQRAKEAEINAPRAVAVQRAQLASRQADAQRYKAELDAALLNLSYAKIVAPVTGVVGRRSVEIGQQVSPGQQLMGITNLEELWVTANFKETQLRNIKPGQSVRIHVDAINSDYDGYVESMPGASGAKYSLLPPENATGNYVKVVQRLPVRIRFRSEQTGLERLRPGMSVEPKVTVN